MKGVELVEVEGAFDVACRQVPAEKRELEVADLNCGGVIVWAVSGLSQCLSNPQ